MDMSTEKDRWNEQMSRKRRAVLECLADCARKRGLQVYLVGGAVRDLILGTPDEDLDFAVESGALELLQEVCQTLGTGTVIELGDTENDTARLVCLGMEIDVSGYRYGATSIEKDLVRRDFTINAAAISLEDLLGDDDAITIIDPLDGRHDCEHKLVRACPGCFDDDPLRMLRAYRFSAQLDFAIELLTLDEIETKARLSLRVAAERISHELDLIIAGPRACKTMQKMRASGLLLWVLPELYAGYQVKQPPFHHLDVMDHNLQTLLYAEQVAADPHRYFRNCEAIDFAAAAADGADADLKWAALLHDIGKPATREIDEQRGGRITFYNHDEHGAAMIADIGCRLRWSTDRTKRITGLVRMHMHPFHLANVLLQDEKLSSRAKLKICKRAGADLTLLFMLAMADSLAGQGPEKPAGIERQLAALCGEISEFYKTSVQPVLDGPKLLTGHDLIATFGLEPGPQIGDLLEGVETAVVDGAVTSRDEALLWVEKELEVRRE